MPADIDPYEEEVEPEARQHYIDTGPENHGEDEVIRYNVQGAATTFRFGGRISGWYGRAPDEIADAQNPTIDLKAGNNYTVVWENTDGAPHDFVIQDSDGERIVGSEVYADRGETIRVNFRATPEMDRYICTVHPSTMVGDINITGTEGTQPGQQAGQLEEPPGPGAAEGDVPQLAVTTNMLEEDRSRPDSWLQYSKGLGQRGYTDADQLDAENVASLEKKYSIPTESAGLQANPIVVPSDPPVMYYTTSNISVVAANARTGETYWKFDYALPQDAAGQTGRNRGVTVWQDKVFLATTDSHLVALNRYTGEKEWDTLMLTEEQQEMGQPKRMSITQMPLAYDGKVHVGMSGDFGGWAVVSAVDADSGEIEWQTNMVPKDGWVGDSWRFGSNAPWMSPALDPETNTVFYAVGNPNPMLNGAVRPGPNKYGDSITALDAETGDIKWTDQQISHELWDYDTHATPNIYDMEVDGETRRVVSTDYKAGWTYVYDVETGRLLERTEPWAKQDHEWADHFLALPPRGEENAAAGWPGTPGATEWPPCAYSEDTGLRYIAGVDGAQTMYWDPDWTYDPQGDIHLEKAGGYGPTEDTTVDVWVKAVDPASGDVKWTTELPDASETWSMWRAWPGGTTATAGGLVFVASSGGKVYALDDETGERIWSGNTDADRITAAPVVWTDPENRTQYVAVAADDEIEVWSSSGFGD